MSPGLKLISPAFDLNTTDELNAYVMQKGQEY